MPIIVQKFGGTSLANADRVRAAAQRAINAKLQGSQVVVVVSAQGKMTDELVNLAKEIHPHPPRREMDVLVSTGEQISIALFAMAVQKLGHPAISFTAGQVGILTDNMHTRARILRVKPDRMQEELDKGNIVIVAGFQGVDDRNNITTLGRGGSDTTAVALAAALKADKCEIYTDVDGVFTADPRVVSDSRKLNSISYDEMMELASLGAGVLHIRSVELAKRFSVNMVVRSSLNQTEGTLVCAETSAMEQVMARGCALAKDEAEITLLQIPEDPCILPRIFQELSKSGINVDVIALGPSSSSTTDLSFTVSKDDLKDACDITEAVAKEVGAGKVITNDEIAKVSIVGVGMRSQPGVAAQLFGAIGQRGIRIRMISTSEIKISCIVDAKNGEEALKAAHEAFGLGQNKET